MCDVQVQEEVIGLLIGGKHVSKIVPMCASGRFIYSNNLMSMYVPMSIGY